MFYGSANRKSPEKLTEDFRRYLRERALYHSEFYRRLSNEPNLKRLSSSGRNSSSNRNIPCQAQTVNAGNGVNETSWRFRDSSKVNTKPKLCDEDISCSADHRCSLINKSSSDEKIQSSLGCLNETVRSKEPLVASYGRNNSSSSSSSSSSSTAINSSSNNMSATTYGGHVNDSTACIRGDDQHQHLCSSKGCNNSCGGCIIKDRSRHFCSTVTENEGHSNSNVIGGISTLGVSCDDNEGNCIDRSSKHKQKILHANSAIASATTAGVVAVTTNMVPDDCGNNDDNTSASHNHIYDKQDDDDHDAINNKNKMFAREEWDRSNYLTFVPATSLDRFDCPTDLARRRCNNRSCSISGDNNETTTTISGSTTGNYSATSNLSDPGCICCDQKKKDSDTCMSLDCSDLYLNNSCSFKSLIQQRKKALFEHIFGKDCSFIGGCVDGGGAAASDGVGKVQDNLKVDLSESDLPKLSFPCVEKLVKMYTKLLEEKKNESPKFLADDVDSKKMDVDEDKLVETTNGGSGSKDKRIKAKTDLNRNSPMSDEGCGIGQSPYSSDYEETPTEDAQIILSKEKEKVIRSSSSDSALGGMEDEVSGGERSFSPTESPPINTGRRMTLTVADIPLRPALLPLAEPTNLPDSSNSIDTSSAQPISTVVVGALLTQTAIPSKVLLEERVVEIPEDRFGGSSLSNSRRESAQSCMSDYNSEYGGVRYVRTPSVVVSDYSDDVMCGITLEEIEYFRQHRLRRRSSADTAATEKDDTASDVSASSSCSNLYYCGSTISALDGADCYINGIRTSIDRKISDCSTCSTVSGDEDDDSFIVHDFQDQLSKEQQTTPQQSQIRKSKKH